MALKYGMETQRRSSQVLISIGMVLFLITAFAPELSYIEEKLYLSDILEDEKPNPAYKSKHSLQ